VASKSPSTTVFAAVILYLLFVTNFIQLVQHVPYQESSLRVWGLQRDQLIKTVKYADDLVLLAKEKWCYRVLLID
jgi:hypothetical protein